MCFDQFREKQNREAPLSCDPRVEANPRSFVRRATAPRETAHLEENAREQSALSKKHKLTSRPIAGRDQTNARAEYIRTIPKHESGMTNERSKYAYGELGREHRFCSDFVIRSAIVICHCECKPYPMTTDTALICPRCELPLKEVRTSAGVFWACENCGGRAITIALLRNRLIPESINT